MSTKIIRVFENLTSNGLAYCKLCLKNENERKLVFPNAVRGVMSAMNLEIFDDLTVCFICESRAKSAYRIINMINFAIAANVLFREMRNSDNLREVEAFLTGTNSDDNKPEKKELYAAAANSEALLDEIIKETHLTQTEMLIIDSVQRAIPRNLSKRVFNVQPVIETVVIDDDDTEKDPLGLSDPLEPSLEKSSANNKTQFNTANSTTVSNVLKERNVDRPLISVIPEAKLTEQKQKASTHMPFLQLVPTNNQILINDNVSSHTLSCNQNLNLPEDQPTDQNDKGLVTQNNNILLLSLLNSPQTMLATNLNVSIDQVNEFLAQNVSNRNQLKNISGENSGINIMARRQNLFKVVNEDSSDLVNGNRIGNQGIVNDDAEQSVRFDIEELLKAKVEQLYNKNVNNRDYSPHKKKIRKDSEGDNEKNGHVIKEPVKKDGMIDFEDKIPMDVISFVDATDPNSHALMSNLVHTPSQRNCMGAIAKIRSIHH